MSEEQTVTPALAEASVLEKPSKMFTVRMTPKFYKEIVKQAAEAGMSLNQYGLQKLGCTEPIPAGKPRGRKAGAETPAK